MISWFRKWSYLEAIWRKQPVIVIGRYGWRTDRPKVDVTIRSRTGSHGLFTLPDNEAGNAQALLAAKDLSRLTGLPWIDVRPWEKTRDT